VEKDGDLGDGTGPTSPDETVYVDQIVDPYVVINLNPCFRWYMTTLNSQTSKTSKSRVATAL